MAKVDVKLGTSLIAPYNGNADDLNAFIDAAKLFIDLVNSDNEVNTQAAAQLLVARFIKTRLTGVAHQAVSNCSTTDEILETLKLQCQTKENSDSLTLKIKNIKQNSSVSEFCTEVENMCVLLKNAYIKETIPPAKATEMSTKVGISSLVQNIQNNTTKLILKAGNFANINEAVQKVLQNSNEPDDVIHNVYFTNRANYSHTFRGNNRNTGNRYINNRARYNRNFQDNNRNAGNRNINDNDRFNSNKNYYAYNNKGNYGRNTQNYNKNRNNYSNNRGRNNFNKANHRPAHQNVNNSIMVTNTSDITANSDFLPMGMESSAQ